MPQDQQRPPMRFSIFSVLDHHPALPRSIGGLYEEALAEIQTAERLGFEGYWVAEHHFHEYGASPNPAVFLAAAAQRTRRIRLGPAISVLPFRNPIQVAEDYAMLDLLSGGRAMLGVGSGYLKHEFAGFNIPPEEKRERFEEALTILKRALSGERVSFQGKYHRVEDLAINVQPVQSPHPPLYVATLRPEGSYFIGRQGNRLMTVPYASVGRMEEIGDLIDSFRRGYAEAGNGDPDDAALVALHTHVAESDAEARHHAAQPFDLYVETRLYARRQVYDDILKSRLGLFGSVERVIDQLIELHGLGVRHVMLLMNFGAMPAETVRRSMTLFAEAVAPAVNQRLARAAAAE